MRKFHAREGHCRVVEPILIDGLNLTNWVRNKRHKKGKLTPGQISRLESLGFSWDPHSDQWEEGFSALQKFHAREGHCHVIGSFILGSVRLGLWVNNQRMRKSRLSTEQISRLDSLGFSWDPHSDQWEEGFSALQNFHAREGHCRVTQRFVLDGTRLGAWVSNQRQKRAKLAPERIKRLNSLGFIWKP